MNALNDFVELLLNPVNEYVAENKAYEIYATKYLSEQINYRAQQIGQIGFVARWRVYASSYGYDIMLIAKKVRAAENFSTSIQEVISDCNPSPIKIAAIQRIINAEIEKASVIRREHQKDLGKYDAILHVFKNTIDRVAEKHMHELIYVMEQEQLATLLSDGGRFSAEGFVSVSHADLAEQSLETQFVTFLFKNLTETYFDEYKANEPLLKYTRAYDNYSAENIQRLMHAAINQVERWQKTTTRSEADIRADILASIGRLIHESERIGIKNPGVKQFIKELNQELKSIEMKQLAFIKSEEDKKILASSLRYMPAVD